MFTADLFTIAPQWKDSAYTNKKMNKQNVIFPHSEIYLAIRRNKELMNTTEFHRHYDK